MPDSIRPGSGNVTRVEALVERIEERPWKLAWEPRGGWPLKVAGELCGRHGVIHCVDPLAAEGAHGETVYWGLHGRGGYGYRYPEADLNRLALLCEAAQTRGLPEAYVVFNDTSMREGARRFIERIR